MKWLHPDIRKLSLKNARQRGIVLGLLGHLGSKSCGWWQG